MYVTRVNPITSAKWKAPEGEAHHKEHAAPEAGSASP